MSTLALKLNNLSKTYNRGKHRIEAVKDISLTVASGQVFGFLGPNGAGKSTTIRMIMGLIKPTSGDIMLFGKQCVSGPIEPNRIGSLVEGATFYEYLSARRNLEVLALAGGYHDEKRINALLEQAQLALDADRLVRTYSTGMKQRLGVAAALLSNPDLVILDEPTNGLDPAGIRQMRDFIRRTADEEGTTVFLSSHMLSEIEQVCDSVAIIDHGRVIFEGKVNDLLQGTTTVRIEADPTDHALEILKQTYEAKQEGEKIILNAHRDNIPEIIYSLVSANVRIFDISSRTQSLEDIFLSLTIGRADLS